MACDISLTTRLLLSCLQTCRKLIVKTCYPQACCKLFQQIVTRLQMTSIVTNLIITDLLQFDEIGKFVVANLLTSGNKPVQLTTCNKSAVFSVV